MNGRRPCRSAGPGEATGNDLVAEIAAKMEVGGTGDIGTTLTAGRAGRCRTPRLDGTGKGARGAEPPARWHDRAARRRGFEGGAQRSLVWCNKAAEVGESAKQGRCEWLFPQ